jgi:uncharacterized protein (DUF433 family)
VGINSTGRLSGQTECLEWEVNNVTAQIIDRGRGPEIEGTRVTVYRIMDFVRDGSSRSRISAELDLSTEQVEAALDYIDTNREEVEKEYLRVLDRVQRRNPPQVEAGRPASVAELRQRVLARRSKDITHADSGRQ